ncbi:MAG: hypothetical protein ACR2KF_08570 [Nitrososphaeraceae archaeon]
MDKVALKIVIPKDLDEEFRKYVHDKYPTYRKIVLSKEGEAAIRMYLKKRKKESEDCPPHSLQSTKKTKEILVVAG